jgi:hypothetical protein
MSLDAKALVAIARKQPILCVCGLVSVILLAVIYLRFDLSSAQQAELDQKNEDIKRYRANLANSAQLAEQVETVVKANQLVRDRAIAPGDLAKNLQYFYHIEAETGVKYSELRPGAAAPKGTATGIYVPVNFNLTVTGDFPKIITFLRQLERGERFYRLNTMTATQTTSEVILALNIDLLGQP